ncbi:hypothetical protein [Saccharibacillus alkalitolerans]|uniref:Uncharacterized protein n=1 Tax=Saccharibacillus alkalitolerans TaxID=2705290 RepID=A0ABX0FCJ5_9BACL|nr:hypothetical protein [Saccharibacillus alkalitolerans]NGZ77709.1 hypothetical protein [Saccharibacillus alkalitolerans]
MKTIQDFFTLVHQSDIIAYLFGITLGILTLVGFAAVFVSINSQHKAQKARETYWELASFPYSFSNYKDENIGKLIFQKVNLYNNIITPADKNTTKIIDWIRHSLLSVSIVWSIFLLILAANLHLIEYILIFVPTVLIISLFYFFTRYLNNLKNIKKVAGLFSIEEIFDVGNISCDIPTPSLAAISSRLRIAREEKNLYSISVGFPVPFNNFVVRPIITGVNEVTDNWNENFKFINDTDSEKITFIDSKDTTWWLGSPLYWHEIEKISLPEDINELNIQLDYNSRKGLTMVFFRSIPVRELLNLDRITKYSTLPDGIQEQFSLNFDKGRRPTENVQDN